MKRVLLTHGSVVLDVEMHQAVLVAAGAITTLGRGGSDLSATVIGAALGLAEVQVWKDVDGELSSLFIYMNLCLSKKTSKQVDVTAPMHG